MRRLLLIAIALTAVLVVLAFLPAGLLTAQIESRVPSIRFDGVSGSIWNGRVVSLRVSGRDIGALRWRVRPMALLGARLQADVEVFGTAGTAVRTVSGAVWLALPDRVGADAVHAELSASVLAPLFVGTGLMPDGVLTVQLDSLSFDGAVLHAISGSALWRQAVLFGAARAALGDVEASFALVEGQVVGGVRDRGGPIAIDGDFQAGLSGYRFEARLAAEDADARAALARIGQPEGGTRRLVVAGRWLPGGLEDVR